MAAINRTFALAVSLCLLMGGAVAAAGVSGAADEDTITIELRDIDIRSAIDALFRNRDFSYSINSDVQGIVPALSFKDVSFDIALKNLLKTAGLVCRVDRGVYIISNKPEPVAAADTPDYSPLPEIEDTTSPELRIEKIPLNYTSASEIIAVMSGQARQYGGNYGSYGNGGYGGGYGGYGGYGGGYGGYGGGYGGNGGGYGGYNSYGGNRSNYGGYSPYGSIGNYGGYSSYGSGRSTYSPGYGGYGGRNW